MLTMINDTTSLQTPVQRMMKKDSAMGIECFLRVCCFFNTGIINNINEILLELHIIKQLCLIINKEGEVKARRIMKKKKDIFF